jgi:hypothetical protein
MRLLCCNHCHTVDEVPDFEGNLDETGGIDPLIEAVVMKHNQRDPMAHGGRNLQFSPIRIAVVEDSAWATDKEGVLKQLQSENKKVGFDAWAYEAVNTYQEDAMTCYRRHKRPDLGAGKPCIDYWSDSKRIGRPTAIGKQILKENEKLGARDPHLCQFCPYFSTVQTQARWERGMYRDN